MFTFSFFKQRAVQILTLGYFLGIFYWIWIRAAGLVGTPHNYLWELLFLGILPIFGGISGFLISKKWGFLSTALGRAIFFFSAGIFVWSLGILVSNYHDFLLGVEVVYPSVSDLFYVLSIPFLIIGLINLSKAIGGSYKLHALRGKAIFAIIPLFTIAISYYIYVWINGGVIFDFTDAGIVEIVLDILYSIQDALLITTISLIYGLSYRAFGGKFKQSINLLLVAFLFYYIADLRYSFTVAQETYYVANFDDLLYLSTMFLISIGICAMDIKGISSRVKTELLMFAPRVDIAINSLVLEIIRRQEQIMGPIAWDEASRVEGLVIDIKNNTLSVEGDPKIVLEDLVSRYKNLFGEASLQICRSAALKTISQVPLEKLPSVLR